jgi:hypothetical protein
MITDAAMLLESAQVLVRAASTYVSTNTIDLSVNRDIGAGHQKKVLWNVEVLYEGGTQITFQQIISANADLSSAVVIDGGIVVPLANLIAGAMVVRTIPELMAGPAALTDPDEGLYGIGGPGLRYFGTQCVSTGTFTAGQHSTRVVADVINVKHHASGWTIL